MTVLTAVLATGALAQGSAAAATLKADYQFQDNFGSSVPGVGDIGPVGDGHKFVTETVGCTPTRVLTFPKGSGAQLNSPATVDNYSVVVLFRLTDLSGYRRILAPGSAGAYLTDNGLYERDGKLAIYDAGPALGANTVFAGNTYAEVAFTYVYSIPPNETVGYVNGVRQAGFTSGTNQFAHYMRFFKDNDSGVC